MPLINCKINVFLTWPEKYIIVTGDYGNGEPKLAITDTKFSISRDSVVTLSPQDNEEVLQQLKACSKRTINCNKYQP